MGTGRCVPTASGGTFSLAGRKGRGRCGAVIEMAEDREEARGVGLQGVGCRFYVAVGTVCFGCESRVRDFVCCPVLSCLFGVAYVKATGRTWKRERLERSSESSSSTSPGISFLILILSLALTKDGNLYEYHLSNACSMIL